LKRDNRDWRTCSYACRLVTWAFTASGTGNQSIMAVPELALVFVHRANLLGCSISGLDAREILIRLIDARTGDGIQDPKLIRLAEHYPSARNATAGSTRVARRAGT
jgi:hypothetical protein